MNAKLKNYLTNAESVIEISNASEASLWLGKVDVIAYHGLDKDEFRSVVEGYRAPPIIDARRYKEFCIDDSMVVFASNALEVEKLPDSAAPSSDKIKTWNVNGRNG